MQQYVGCEIRWIYWITSNENWHEFDIKRKLLDVTVGLECTIYGIRAQVKAVFHTTLEESYQMDEQTIYTEKLTLDFVVLFNNCTENNHSWKKKSK